ncbi:GlsB/YeaQ/YmgE family stress response membrane protein [Gracilimonas sp. BCB1]|uniref:GlsB/YeaQ/YmgE family stress response membrane protein n=1 Tax=Gracilimonas sp. BCB1 TaxID=3152362 RepID=UPI0032D8ED8E
MTLMYLLSYITIGLIIGWLSRVITQDRGVTMLPSLAFGVLGALAGTFIVHAVGLAGSAFYAVVGSVGVLFTVNVFRQDDPIFADTETV